MLEYLHIPGCGKVACYYDSNEPRDYMRKHRCVGLNHSRPACASCGQRLTFPLDPKNLRKIPHDEKPA